MPMETAVVLSMREPDFIDRVTVTLHAHNGGGGLAWDGCWNQTSELGLNLLINFGGQT